ncbi:MAG TPA: 4Fe-4S dicluster domain-containing protein, partial [Lacipirellulaceae bacterium]|nr:4Fe-4S dicluster domain-containing protein [Lacipirellulaceae bacterium]
TSHEGRPTKIEGNPNHPASLGATDVFAQAAVLGLYDSDRSQAVLYRGRPSSWSEAQIKLRDALAKLRANRGSGLAILTETVTSPTLADQLTSPQSDFRRNYPAARWCQYEPTFSNGRREGSRIAFSEPVDAIYDFAAAEVVVSLDADFLSNGPAHIHDAHDFMTKRRAARDTASTGMSRLYVAESCPTITGAVADHRIPIRAAAIAQFAQELGAELQLPGMPSLNKEFARWTVGIANDLKAHHGASIVIVGDSQPPAVHALAHALNDALGNVGHTMKFIAPVEPPARDQIADLASLVEEMAAGRIETLLVLGGNPVFNAPVDLEFSNQLQRVPMRVHLGLYQDETAAQCDWHLPEAHFLEAWGDARAFDGTVSIQQPLIAPLYNGLAASEILSALFDSAGRPGYEIVRDYWRHNWPQSNVTADFDTNWNSALHDGVIAGTAFEPKTDVRLSSTWFSEDSQRPPQQSELELVFQPDPTIFDGRFANNGWLQELPKPITKLTWDNAALISPKLAEKLGVTQHPGINGGEHGQGIASMVELDLGGRTLRAAAWIVPGHADDSITLHFGYGRAAAGLVGNGAGFNAFTLRSSSAPWFAAGVKIRKLSEQYTLACTQIHHSMQGREPVRAFTADEFAKNPHILADSADDRHQQYQQELVPRSASNDAAATADSNQTAPSPLSLYPEYPYGAPKNKWGMAIDLTSCIGCNACVVACQAENNIPVVGKTEVTRGREMHWIRVDRYYEGPSETPTTYFQPVPCMHCENAPCEVVCPVGATVHSADGLNDMVYNRCVGTRYCSNNCPYKVRRFNFLAYADFKTESLKLGRNPNVTVRSRGVMEKCTYCVQRIRAAQIDSEIAGRPVQDGDVVTACQAACPTQAIVFGDMNDPNSRVSKMKAEPLNYGLLAELNTRPRTTYLAALRNPNSNIMD